MLRVNDHLRVNASLHAAERALERIPELAGCPRFVASVWVEQRVGEAIIAGRKARRAPRWCVREAEEGLRRRGKAPKQGTARFVWTEDDQVAFLIRRVNDGDFPEPPIWLVITVMTPPAEPS